MFVTTMASLIYALVTLIFHKGDIILAATDILLLGLAFGVVVLSAVRFARSSVSAESTLRT